MYSIKNAEKVDPKQKIKSKRAVHLYLPPNLALTEMSVSLTGERGQIVKTTSVALLYTYLYKNVLFNQDRDTERWVQISWGNLRTILGSDYREVVDTLIKTKFLDRLEHNEDGVMPKDERGHYWNCASKAGECKKYRIPAHLLSPTKLFTVVKEPVTTMLTNKIASLNKPVRDEVEKYRELALFNMSDIILLDTPACRAVLDELFARGSVRLGTTDYLEIFNHYIFEVPVVCDFGHRAHHRVVRLNKRLRPFLRFRDDLDSAIVELDFVASQPSILANIDAKLIKKYAPECAAAIPLFAKYEKKPDFEHYRQHCFAGTIYEYLRDEFNATHGSKRATPVDRDDAKNICYNAFFSNYKYREAAASVEVSEKRLTKVLLAGTQAQVDAIHNTLFKKRSYELFKRLFPSVHSLFAAIKDLDWSAFNPGEQHANNCLLAQRIESGLIYTRFVAALVKGGITRFGTTHDAINLKAQDEDKARKIIQKEIKKMGLNLNLKTKTQEASAPVASAPVLTVDELL